jgi:predicted lipoprotein with Yx(FWY)xxD motif
MNRLAICALALSTLLPASAAFAAGMLTDSKGMTLYTFDKDKGKVSACYGDCAKNWPPYIVNKGDKMGKDWGKTKRKDGAMQWTYEGHPVYFYVDDKKAGDATGDGKGGVWHVVKEM